MSTTALAQAENGFPLWTRRGKVKTAAIITIISTSSSSPSLSSSSASSLSSSSSVPRQVAHRASTNFLHCCRSTFPSRAACSRLMLRVWSSTYGGGGGGVGIRIYRLYGYVRLWIVWFSGLQFSLAYGVEIWEFWARMEYILPRNWPVCVKFATAVMAVLYSIRLNQLRILTYSTVIQYIWTGVLWALNHQQSLTGDFSIGWLRFNSTVKWTRRVFVVVWRWS